MTSFILRKPSIFFVALLSLILITNSCGLYKRSDVKDNPINDADKRQKNMEEGKGIRGIIAGKSNRGGTFDFATSNEMWRASLDVLDFIPLSTADYGGGIVITDWYSDKDNEAIKISVKFLSNEIRADAINVTIYQKNCRAYEKCQANNLDGKIKEELQLAILKKASQIEKIALKKKK
jgi:hypothetical protein